MLTAKERYAVDPDYRERKRVQARARHAKLKNKPLTEEEILRRREYQREYARKRRMNPAKRSRDLFLRRSRYQNDPEYREKVKATVRTSEKKNRTAHNLARWKRMQDPDYRRRFLDRMNRRRRKFSALGITANEVKRLSGWRWVSDFTNQQASNELQAGWDFHDRWMESLDGGEPVW